VLPVIWTHRAKAGLFGIGDYIACRNPPAATRLVAEILDQALVLNTLPRSGRIVPELGNESIRELIHGNYRIVYRIDDDALRILTVFEGHRVFGMRSLEPGISGEHGSGEDGTIEYGSSIDVADYCWRYPLLRR